MYEHFNCNIYKYIEKKIQKIVHYDKCQNESKLRYFRCLHSINITNSSQKCGRIFTTNTQKQLLILRLNNYRTPCNVITRCPFGKRDQIYVWSPPLGINRDDKTRNDRINTILNELGASDQINFNTEYVSANSGVFVRTYKMIFMRARGRRDARH